RAGGDAAGDARGQERPPRDRRTAARALPLPRLRHHGDNRPRLRGRRHLRAEDLRVLRVAVLDLPAHLLADRVPQSLRSDERMGVGVLLAAAARAVDHRHPRPRYDGRRTTTRTPVTFASATTTSLGCGIASAPPPTLHVAKPPVTTPVTPPETPGVVTTGIDAVAR